MSPTYVASEFPDDLKVLSVIGDRLNTGEELLSESQFVAAMEEGFQTLSRATLDEGTKTKLVEIVRKVNGESPENLVVPGLESWVTKSVLASVRKQDMGVTEVQEGGNRLVRDFVRGAKVQGLISQLGIQASQLNLKRCFRTVLNQVAGKVDVDQNALGRQVGPTRESCRQPTGRCRRYSRGWTATRVRGIGPLTGRPPAEMPTEEEAQSRTAEQEKAQSAIRETQMANLVNNIDSYVEQGMLDADGAERLRKAHKVPDADDASKFVIVQKDPDSGEMVPVRRRGQKRFVQRGRDGWELA